MKILIDINHPAHVHYFKNSIRLLREKGHDIIITARDRYPVFPLLDAYNEKYYNRGKGSDHVIGKLLYIAVANARLLKIALKTRPHLFLSFGTPYPNHIAWLTRKPGINFQDTENATLMFAITKPFASVYCTPRCFQKDLGEKHIRFDGYMESTYLHPNYFTPNQSIYQLLKIPPHEKYIILRFVSWKASHDIGHRGISLEMKRKLVKQLSSYGSVFISSEAPLPQDLLPYSLRIPPQRMHDALAFASLLYGESATMASECAMLGTPSIYLDNNGRGYTTEEEKKYRLVFNYNESEEHQEKSLQKAMELLANNQLHAEMQLRRQKMLEDTIDVTAFMTWFIENYPQSRAKMKEDPHFQSTFKYIKK